MNKIKMRNLFITFVIVFSVSISRGGSAALNSSFFSSCDSGKKSDLKKIMKKAQLINQVDSENKNCLMHALENEHVEFALWLIRNSKIDIHWINKKGKSALWIAVDLDLKSVVQELLYRGVNVDIVSKDNHQSLLHVASKIGNIEVVQTIINKKTNKTSNKIINIKDLNGDTALVKAIIFDHPIIVKKLLKAGADPSLKNNEGLMAKDFAKQNQSEEIIKMLQ